MKILHINTKDTGGAANAALRLHQSLLQKDIHSDFLCLEKFRNDIPNVHALKKKINTAFSKKVYQKLFDKQNSRGAHEAKLKDLPKDYELFSFPTTGIDITRHDLYQEADIIHLHWVPRFLDYPSFFSKNKKPVVWTLHDMNSFLGGFHYEGDEQKNKQAFKTLNEEIVSVKKQALANLHQMYIVAPSQWIQAKARQSEILGKFDHFHIPNGIDKNSFKLLDQHFCRSVFNLPQDKTILLFISDNINNHRKGFDLLLQAIANLNVPDVVLCAVGNNTQPHEQIKYISGIKDERLMNILFNAADVFMLPSREDNFPNVMLEATACGTPVIAFPIGGIPELIRTGFNGMLAESVSAEALSHTILNFIHNQHRFDRQNISTFTANHYDISRSADRYIELYQSIIEK